MPTDPADLEAALREADSGSEQAIGELLQALADAELLVLVASQQDEAVELVTLHHDDHPYVPAFTNETLATTLVPSDQPLARVDTQTLAASWPAGTALAINPGGQPGGWLEAEGVQALAVRFGPDDARPGGS